MLTKEETMAYHDTEFVYNDNLSYDKNFKDWLMLVDAERRFYKEKPITTNEAIKSFNIMYGTKWSKEEQYGSTKTMDAFSP